MGRTSENWQAGDFAEFSRWDCVSEDTCPFEDISEFSPCYADVCKDQEYDSLTTRCCEYVVKFCSRKAGDNGCFNSQVLHAMQKCKPKTVPARKTVTATATLRGVSSWSPDHEDVLRNVLARYFNVDPSDIVIRSFSVKKNERRRATGDSVEVSYSVEVSEDNVDFIKTQMEGVANNDDDLILQLQDHSEFSELESTTQSEPSVANASTSNPTEGETNVFLIVGIAVVVAVIAIVFGLMLGMRLGRRQQARTPPPTASGTTYEHRTRRSARYTMSSDMPMRRISNESAGSGYIDVRTSDTLPRGGAHATATRDDSGPLYQVPVQEGMSRTETPIMMTTLDGPLYELASPTTGFDGSASPHNPENSAPESAAPVYDIPVEDAEGFKVHKSVRA
eukprot:m.32915 g.32915  ORF g.32915 m.32915 type:complete len:392 (+) comp5589_c0_seq1:3062-4237(+)